MTANSLYFYKADVISVYDGDTITVNIDLGMGVWMRKQKIRLFGINAPEVRGAEKDRGKETRDFLRSMILGQTITLQTIKDKKGKYGRWLGVVWIGEDNLNELLVTEGLAISVDY